MSEESQKSHIEEDQGLLESNEPSPEETPHFRGDVKSTSNQRHRRVAGLAVVMLAVVGVSGYALLRSKTSALPTAQVEEIESLVEQSTCMTDDRGDAVSPVKGACVFPFKYEGRIYNGCTSKDSEKGFWCSTKTWSDGEHMRGRWGYCHSRHCPFVPWGPGTCSVGQLMGANDHSATGLQACTGECDADSQCASGLKCFQRSNGETIPGCSGGGGGADWDYCYDPTLTLIPLTGANDNSATGLQACTGECDADSQCASGLKCFQRSNREQIPGCSGGGGGADWDYCYDPTLLTGDALRACPGNRCLTLSHQGLIKECVFPFKYKGKVYNSCTRDHIKEERCNPWCATKTDGSGNYIEGEWTNCPEKCWTPDQRSMATGKPWHWCYPYGADDWSEDAWGPSGAWPKMH